VSNTTCPITGDECVDQNCNKCQRYWEYQSHSVIEDEEDGTE
jgi:hypothetical protein